MKDPPGSEFCGLGDLWARAGNLTSAEESFREGLKREPHSYMCHRELGEIDRVKGRWAAAREHLEFVVRFYPEADPRTFLSLALVYRAQGNQNLAREILPQRQRIFPNDQAILRMASH
jgi:tetratricopeptide (TPR) repeat protein